MGGVFDDFGRYLGWGGTSSSHHFMVLVDKSGIKFTDYDGKSVIIATTTGNFYLLLDRKLYKIGSGRDAALPNFMFWWWWGLCFLINWTHIKYWFINPR